MTITKNASLLILLTIFTISCSADTQTTPNTARDSKKESVEVKKEVSEYQKRINETIHNATRSTTNADQETLKNMFESSPEQLQELIVLIKKSDECAFCKNSDNPYKKYVPKRLLFVGPPGVGKTTLAFACSEQLKRPCYIIRMPLLADEYQHSVSANLLRIIQDLESLKKPIVIVLDEINILTESREYSFNKDANTGAALWLILDRLAINPNILLIGTANDITKLPPQLKDRFEGKVIELSPGSFEERAKFLDYYLLKKPCEYSSEYFMELVQKLEKWSYRKIEAFVENAWQYHLAHFDTSIPLSKDSLEIAYERFKKGSQLLSSEKKFSFRSWIRDNYTEIQAISTTLNISVLISTIVCAVLYGPSYKTK